MKARSLQAAVDFYLQSRRRLGFALKSEGALLQNLVRHAQRSHHQPNSQSSKHRALRRSSQP